MCNIWKTGPDSQTITIEQNVQFQVGIYQDRSIQDYQLQHQSPNHQTVGGAPLYEM